VAVAPGNGLVRFGVFELDTKAAQLSRNGIRIRLPKQPLQVLCILIERPGEVVTRDELQKLLWSPDVFVDFDQGLNKSIQKLRESLGDSPESPRYIETIPRTGYRFIAPIGTIESSQTGTAQPAELTSVLTGARRETNSGSRRRFWLAFAAAAPVLIAILGLSLGFLIRWAIGRKGVPEGHAVSYPLIEQRVTSNPPEDPIKGAVVSPDGKYVAYGDPTGLYLRQMSTGETRPWSLPNGFVAWPNCWFPDSTHLLAMRIEGHSQELDGMKTSLYKLSLLGGDPQKLMDDASAGSVSPDGSRIAYLPSPNVANEIWMMDSNGANPRKVVSAGGLNKPGSIGSWIFNPVWAPNGKRLAYIERNVVAETEPVEPAVWLLMIDANGGSPTVVLDDPRIGESLWWAEDGRVLFAYRKKGNYGVYSISIDELTGKAAGPPQAITEAEGGIEQISATGDGKRILLWRANAPDEAFIAKFDARTHQFKEPRRLTLDENENYAAAWTADSKSVLMVSNRTGAFNILKQGIDEMTPQVLAEGGKFPRLSADGLHVLYLSASKTADASLPESLMSKPLVGGTPHEVLRGKRIINYQCAQAPSKVCIFSNLAGSDLIFHLFDLEDGAGREVVRIPNGGNWTLSPNGTKLAVFLDEHRIRFISLGTWVAHDVIVKGWRLVNGDWSANSASVFMPSATPKGVPVILEVDQSGKAHVVLQGSANTEFRAMIQSPDKKYGLLLEVTQVENNAWMVDNF
jgi:DNA-binding winged helix-turn-helix (wHTH) protein/Tol biopolymer transport system component